MAGRNMANPLLRRITSISCSHNRELSNNLLRSLTCDARTKSDLIAPNRFPIVVSANKSFPRVPLGKRSMRCLNKILAPSRRYCAFLSNCSQLHSSLMFIISEFNFRVVRLRTVSSPWEGTSSRILLIIRHKRSGSGFCRFCFRRDDEACLKWSDVLSPRPRSGAASRI